MSATATEVTCPRCQGPMWTEIGGKFWGNGLTSNGKPKPTHKCKDKACGGARWEKDVATAPYAATAAPAPRQAPAPVAPQAAPVSQGVATAQRLGAVLEVWDACFDHVMIRAVPALEEAKVGASPEAISAMVAQLFIASTKNGV